jgi:hypothetical protein
MAIIFESHSIKASAKKFFVGDRAALRSGGKG